MPKNQWPVPNMDNLTPMGLVDLIKSERDIQAEHKFYEGCYRARLDATKGEGNAVEGEKYIANYVEVLQERIDVEAVRAAFSREDLIAKGFLKVTPIVQLKFAEKPQPVQNLKP